MRENWLEIDYKTVVNKITTNNKKLKQKEYLVEGKFPVIDQGQEFIGGYTNDETKLLDCQLPVLVFGDHTKIVKLVNYQFAPGADGTKVLEPKSYFEPKLLHYFTQVLALKIKDKGYARHYQDIEKSRIPLPPFLEQKAIVGKIEELFSELDNGIENLKTALAKLKIYRQAVLKKAFEGEFTREWREKQTNLNTAQELIEEITKTRDQWIEAEIKKNNSEAKRLKTKLKKINVTAPKSTLPHGWAWTSFLQSCHLVVDCHNKTAPYTSEGIHLVRTSNIRDGKLNLIDEIRYVNDETYEYWSRRCPPEPFDLLFTREAPMGEVAIIPENTKVCMGQRLMLIRVFRQLLNEKYLLYSILDSTFQHRFGNTAIGTGVKHLRVGDVENLVFPLCSVEEQNLIVQEIETRLSVCDKIEETITNSLAKAESLRQSILKKAFEGNLLTSKELEAIRNHPDYESAEELIKRIKQERK